jgi:hypothetical protein
MNPGLAWVHGEPMVRLELTTSGLQNRCSTTELHRHENSISQKVKILNNDNSLMFAWFIDSG